MTAMGNVTPLRPARPAPTGLSEAVEQAWEDFVAGRLEVVDSITPEQLGFEAWMRLSGESRSNEYLFALGAYASRVLDERRAERPFSLAGQIVGATFSYAGGLGDPAAMDAEDLEQLADDVIATIPASEVLAALKEAVILAAPTVLAEALAVQEARLAT